jgi:hypothetical protein
MIRTPCLVVPAVVLVMAASTATAQPPMPSSDTQAPAVRQPDRSDLRRHIYVMEGALARAVSFGAQQLTREIRSVVPEMIALSGEPQARGVYLEGYGVFFDVGVPILHQSMVWSLRTMIGQDGKGLAEALNVLKQGAREADGARRVALENAIARLEVHLGPLTSPSPDAGFPMTPAVRPAPPNVSASLPTTDDTVAAAEAAAPPRAPGRLDRKYLQDPNALNRAYTNLVQRELIDAMIDFSLPMALGADEYLTVGARDNMQRDTLAPPDPHEEVMTILMRIKGSDLAAYRAGQIDRDEVRQRVEVREF